MQDKIYKLQVENNELKEKLKKIYKMLNYQTNLKSICMAYNRCKILIINE